MEHGKVTSVKYQKGVVTCDVEAMRVNTKYSDVPVLRPFSGFIQMPKQGMEVTMDTLDDGTRFIENVMAKEKSYPDDLNNGEMAIQVDDGTIISLTKQGNDYNIDISASGNISVSTESPTSTISVDGGRGSVSVSTEPEGNVIIDGIDFDKHVHGENDNSGTTDGPKNP
jgi:phage gp45-like